MFFWILVEDEPKECTGEAEIDAEAETDVDIPGKLKFRIKSNEN